MSDFSNSPYYSTAIAAAQQFGIPSDLFIAQIGQESGFNPNAQNGNATGIAQFMPATAAQYGIDPTNPTQSLFGAAAYDADLYNQTGSYQTMLQKYGTTAGGAGANVSSLAASYDNLNNSTLGGILSWLGGPTSQPNNPTPGTSNAGQQSQSWFSELGTFLGIVTDIPRMVTIIIGFMMILIGLFMLGFKPAVTIVEKAAKAGAVVGE